MSTLDYAASAVNLAPRANAPTSHASFLTRSSINASELRLARIGQLMDVAKAILVRRAASLISNRCAGNQYRHMIAEDRYLALRSAYRQTAFPSV